MATQNSELARTMPSRSSLLDTRPDAACCNLANARLGFCQSIFGPLWHVCRPPNVPQYLRENVGVFADRLDLLFAVKRLIIVRRTVLPSIDAMQLMSPDNLHATGLERTAF
jgi:hypothetical protein